MIIIEMVEKKVKTKTLVAILNRDVQIADVFILV